jgi:hypothetical protein
MSSHSQSPEIVSYRILTNSAGKLERSRLRRCAGMRLADLNLILGELARESTIMIDAGNMINLK